MMSADLLSTDSWIIPKGLAEQDIDKFYLAQLFLAWNAFPEMMVNHSKYNGYGPTNLKALALLEAPEFDEVRDELPSSSANIRFAILEDERFTGSRIDEWQERWLALMQQTPLGPGKHSRVKNTVLAAIQSSPT